MGRARGQRTRDKNKANLPQVPKNMKSDGEGKEEGIPISLLEKVK